MEKHLLSKSTFIRGNQCLKSLYLNKKRSFLRDRMPKERQLVFQRGHKVGELAQGLFPGGINMSPGHPAAFRKALLNTRENIDKGFPVIYEAAFQHNEVLIFLDILVHTATGWHAYEVKSSGGISDTYRLDAALQYYVISGTGLELNGISIVHIDKDYLLKGELDPKGLFKIVDVTEEAISSQEYVKEQIVREKEALNLAHSPNIEVGAHCREPYDCDFLGHCWKNIPMPEKKDPSEQIDPIFLRSFTKNTSTPVFVKLLTMRSAIPMYQTTHPYQEIAYGYALEKEGRSITRLFPHEENPEHELIPSLLSELDGISNIICFGQSIKLESILTDGISINDLESILLPDSEFFTQWKDKPELERLRIIFSLGKDSKLPDYGSDAIAEHHFLEKYPDEGVKNHLEEYANSWLRTLSDLYQFLKSNSA